MLKRKAYSYLLDWQKKPTRKPLIVRGARQVGKTSLIKEFGQNEFENLITFNLELPRDQKELSMVQSIEDFERLLRKKKLSCNEKTLIFFDEIQNLPHLVKLLRFFHEERPQWPVISSGSLMSAVLEKAKISMPVGRLEFLYLYPLDFFEFLQAINQNALLQELKAAKVDDQLSPQLHEFALEFFYQHAWMGGMPEVVATYAQTQNYELLPALYEGLLLTYKEDVFKYESTANSKYLQYVIETAPLHVGQQITYENFGNSQYRSREMSEAFSTLEKVMLVRQILATQSRSLPLLPKPLRSKKLIFLDSGLVNYQHKVDVESFTQQKLEDIYKGRVAEQIVAQNLLAQSTYALADLFYWSRPLSEGSAEVDFCFNFKGRVVGVEVKAGTSSRLRSLFSFGQLVEDSVLVRVYSGPLRQEEISIKNQSFPLLSVPFYLAPRLKELL